MFGAAACSVGRCVFLVGGRTGRRYVRKTYVCDTDTMRWTALKAGAQEPPGSDGHSLTRVSPNTLLFFGGQGKKLNNTLYCLDTQTYTWRIVEASGAKAGSAVGAHGPVGWGRPPLHIWGSDSEPPPGGSPLLQPARQALVPASLYGSRTLPPPGCPRCSPVRQPHAHLRRLL
eukprot:jgi/Botrbrau1/5440/Bobra.182_1s0042.1